VTALRQFITKYQNDQHLYIATISPDEFRKND